MHDGRLLLSNLERALRNSLAEREFEAMRIEFREHLMCRAGMRNDGRTFKHHSGAAPRISTSSKGVACYIGSDYSSSKLDIK